KLFMLQISETLDLNLISFDFVDLILGKRKSAVELLQESKANYVKSESVLDTKQELKNAEHLTVRSPNRIVEVVSTLPRGSHHCLGSFPFSICPTCSPYSYTTSALGHLDSFQLQTLREHYVAQYRQLERETSSCSSSGGGKMIGA